MKTPLNKLLIQCALIVIVSLILAGQVSAQIYTTIYSFTSAHSGGISPEGGVILSGNTLYGTGAFGDSGGNGSVFRMNTDGSSFTNLYGFTAGNYGINIFTNNDGGTPVGELVLSGNTLYGATEYAGRGSDGTLFAINTDGSNFRVLHTFSGSDGSSPHSGLVLSGNTLFGTTYTGGSFGYGTIYAINTDGSGFETVTNFNGSSAMGGSPYGGLILSGNILYGTASGDDTSSSGTVFAINTNGTGLTILHHFNGNTDGVEPYGELVLSGSTLYGTTVDGGTWDDGTVFAVNIDGTGFTNLYIFNSQSNGGCNPHGGLALVGNTLFGTTKDNGTGVQGTLFAINTDGSGFEYLHRFGVQSGDGSTPITDLIVSNNIIYGTTYFGGGSGQGTVFSLSVPTPPQMVCKISGGAFVLAWPTNSSQFFLQSSTNLSSPSGWSIVSPSPVVNGTQNIATNPLSGTQMFFRLSL